MTVTIEQVMNCDICGEEIFRSKQTVPHKAVAQVINAPDAVIRPGSIDVCGKCWGPLLSAFHVIKTAKQAERVKPEPV